jgi:hypothetical protein
MKFVIGRRRQELNQNINLLNPNTYCMYRHLYHSEILCFAHNAFQCFAYISEQRATISVYSINLSIFITEAESVYCAVWFFKSDSYSFVLKELICEVCLLFVYVT